jgi:hypothetical protein
MNTKVQVTWHNTIEEAKSFDDRIGEYDRYSDPLFELVRGLDKGLIIRMVNTDRLNYKI